MRANGLSQWRRASLPQTRVEQEFDRMFDQLFYGRPEQTGWRIPMNAWEDEEHVHFEVDMPGVSKDELEVYVHEGKLRISGERKPVENRTYHISERPFGKFVREVTLPEVLDFDSIEAELKQGVLHITFAKKSEAKPRKIEVSGE